MSDEYRWRSSRDRDADVLGVVAPLDETESAENVPRSITRVELIEVAWTSGVLLQPRAATPAVDDRLDAPCCVEQEPLLQ
jgi:hypothetical protein